MNLATNWAAVDWTMNVFQEYKPIRNKIATLARDDALAVIWAYSQFLQVRDFRFPDGIEVLPAFLKRNFPQQWVAEWELEVLAKEVILNSNAVATKGHTLRKWKTLSEVINSLKAFENNIYGEFGSQENVFIELIRIAHRQFIWQVNRPSLAALLRCFRIFNRPGIDEICLERLGLSVQQIYMCGFACMAVFLAHPAISIPFSSNIKALPDELFEKFFSFTSRSLMELKSKLRTEQQYNSAYAYAYSSLRAYPLIRMPYQGAMSLVCPMMTPLFWRFTNGLYYELISVPEFANEFGDGFQDYVGEVIARTCTDEMQRIAERKYIVGKNEKRSVDWIVTKGNAAIFLECKSKRLSWNAKVSLTDLAPLVTDIDNMAEAVVQIYKTLKDYLDGAYPHFPLKQDIKIFPAVVTPENWRMFGPAMMTKLKEAVIQKCTQAKLPNDLIKRMPYAIFALEELEEALQIIATVDLAEFLEGKLMNKEKCEWDWHGYMIDQYPKHARRELFEADYRNMFSELFQVQGVAFPNF